MSESIPLVISRSEANQQGLKRYFTGNPCKRGHLSQRDTINGNCVMCKQEYRKTDRSKELHKGYANTVEAKEARIIYQRSDSYVNVRTAYKKTDVCKRTQRLYKKLNAGKVCAWGQKHRALKLQATPIWYEKTKVELIYTKAKEWSKILGCDLQVDHIVPLNSKLVCGLHCWSNLQLLDKPLNGSKRNKLLTCLTL
ncbi:hypothetical protein M0R04_14920 [Candidatus Dojkabacteria bacterium]|jgi:hypothetical protein|nr:hypothetical protein [Candidatus Dojkabacteria bacterium]